MENAAEIKGLKKYYKDFTLDIPALDIPKGFSAAVIGANGAGKTTLIDSMCGVTGISEGGIRYLGKYDTADCAQVRNAIGYCSSVNFFPQDWTLRTIASSMAIGFDNFDEKRFYDLCGRLDICSGARDLKKRLYKMSDGNKMRACLAAVFARDTELLVLDEPASTLDPLARDLLCELFREYLSERDGERTIIFSTHNIADMELATDYAIFMSRGRVTEYGFTDDLKEKYILVHGESSCLAQAKPLLLSCTSGPSGFEGLAPAENAEKLSGLDTVFERPTLHQLSVGLLRKAEENAKK